MRRTRNVDLTNEQTVAVMAEFRRSRDEIDPRYWGTDDEAVERHLMRPAVERVVEGPDLPPPA
jgi:hypothetical protein